MRAVSNPYPEIGEIQFQISLLNIVSRGVADRQMRELEELLIEQTAPQKH